MKKILAMLLAVMMLLSVVSCAGKDKDNEPSEGDNKPSEGDNKPSEGDNKPSEGDNKPEESFLATASWDEIIAAVTANPDAADDPDAEGSGAFGLTGAVVDDAAYRQMLELNNMTEEEYPYNDWFKWKTFLEPMEGAEAYVYESMITSTVFCVVFVRVEDGKSAADAAEALKQGASAEAIYSKWICVAPEIVETYVNGNVAVLMLLDEGYSAEHELMRDNFLALS